MSKPSAKSGARRLMVLAASAMAATLLAACATTPADPQTQVRQLATERWQALLARKWDVAYEFNTPAYRKIRSLDDYRQRITAVPVRWESAEVLRADCEPERCVVRIMLKSRPALPPFNRTPVESGLEEIWVLQEGRWWHHQRL